MIPSIGRIVAYKFNADDVSEVARNRGKNPNWHGNSVSPGDVLPAMILKAWNPQEGGACNLRVILDGTDSLWVTSRTEGDAEGQWSVPPRV